MHKTNSPAIRITLGAENESVATAADAAIVTPAPGVRHEFFTAKSSPVSSPRVSTPLNELGEDANVDEHTSTEGRRRRRRWRRRRRRRRRSCGWSCLKNKANEKRNKISAALHRKREQVSKAAHRLREKASKKANEVKGKAAAHARRLKEKGAKHAKRLKQAAVRAEQKTKELGKKALEKKQKLAAKITKAEREAKESARKIKVKAQKMAIAAKEKATKASAKAKEVARKAASMARQAKAAAKKAKEKALLLAAEAKKRAQKAAEKMAEAAKKVAERAREKSTKAIIQAKKVKARAREQAAKTKAAVLQAAQKAAEKAETARKKLVESALKISVKIKERRNKAGARMAEKKRKARAAVKRAAKEATKLKKAAREAASRKKAQEAKKAAAKAQKEAAQAQKEAAKAQKDAREAASRKKAQEAKKAAAQAQKEAAQAQKEAAQAQKDAAREAASRKSQKAQKALVKRRKVVAAAEKKAAKEKSSKAAPKKARAPAMKRAPDSSTKQSTPTKRRSRGSSPLLKGGSDITLRTSDGFCSTAGPHTSCKKSEAGLWEIFTVVNVGGGYISLKTLGQYCLKHGSKTRVPCTRKHTTSDQRMKVEDVGNGQIALSIGGKYCQGTSTGIHCGANKVGPSEKFTVNCLRNCKGWLTATNARASHGVSAPKASSRSSGRFSGCTTQSGDASLDWWAEIQKDYKPQWSKEHGSWYIPHPDDKSVPLFGTIDGTGLAPRCQTGGRSILASISSFNRGDAGMIGLVGSKLGAVDAAGRFEENFPPKKKDELCIGSGSSKTCAHHTANEMKPNTKAQWSEGAKVELNSYAKQVFQEMGAGVRRDRSGVQKAVGPNAYCDRWERGIIPSIKTKLFVANVAKVLIHAHNQVLYMISPFKEELPSTECCTLYGAGNKIGWAEDNIAELCCTKSRTPTAGKYGTANWTGRNSNPLGPMLFPYTKHKWAGLTIGNPETLAAAVKSLEPRCTPQWQYIDERTQDNDGNSIYDQKKMQKCYDGPPADFGECMIRFNIYTTNTAKLQPWKPTKGGPQRKTSLGEWFGRRRKSTRRRRSYFQEKVEKVRDAAAAKAKKLKAAAVAKAKKLKAAAERLAKKASEKVAKGKETAKKVKAAVSEKAKKAKVVVEKTAKKAAVKAKRLKAAAKAKAKKAAAAAKEAGKKAAAAAKKAGKKAAAAAKKVKNKAVALAKKAAAGIKDALKRICKMPGVKKACKAIKKQMSSLKEKVKELKQKANNKISKGLNKLKQWGVGKFEAFLVKMIEKHIKEPYGPLKFALITALKSDKNKGFGAQRFKDRIKRFLNAVVLNPKFGQMLRYGFFYPLLDGKFGNASKDASKSNGLGSLSYDCAAKNLLEHFVGRKHYLKFALKSYNHRLEVRRKLEPAQGGKPHLQADGPFKFNLYKCGGSPFLEDDWVDNKDKSKGQRYQDDQPCNEKTHCAMEVIFDMHFCSRFNDGTKSDLHDYRSGANCYDLKKKRQLGVLARKGVYARLIHDGDPSARCAAWFTSIDSFLRSGIGMVTGLYMPLYTKPCLVDKCAGGLDQGKGGLCSSGQRSGKGNGGRMVQFKKAEMKAWNCPNKLAEFYPEWDTPK